MEIFSENNIILLRLYYIESRVMSINFVDCNCCVGITGGQGIQGPIGVTGQIGAQGDPGRDGAPGLSLVGPIGTPGPDGAPGPPGPPGFGSPGPMGLCGPPGIIGPPGPVGSPGVGICGCNGIQGYQGFQGPRGFTGDQGEIGLKGDPPEITFTVVAADSPNGVPNSSVELSNLDTIRLWSAGGIEILVEQGSALAKMEMNNIIVGSGDPLGAPPDPQRPAFYLNSITNELYIWCPIEGTNTGEWSQQTDGFSMLCECPIGNKGNQGPMGDKGFRGDKGDKGEPGEGQKGEVGDKGEQGENGMIGEIGDTGDKGTMGGGGIMGGIGDSGDDGDDGADGTDGTDGADGADGTDGADGADGAGGGMGPAGLKGYPGDAGMGGGGGGATGAQGADGAKGEKGDMSGGLAKGEKGIIGGGGGAGPGGDMGSKGIIGEGGGDKGIPGEKGAVKGEKGMAGDSVVKGEPGMKGVKGEQSEKGEKGAKGEGISGDLVYQFGAAGGTNPIEPVNGGNTVYGDFSVITGGKTNTMSGSDCQNSVIGGGYMNTFEGGVNCAIMSGNMNTIEGQYIGMPMLYSVGICNGSENIIKYNTQFTYNQSYDGIIAGEKNLLFGSHSMIGGGQENEIHTGARAYGIVPGGYGYGQASNDNSKYSIIGGGKQNEVRGGSYSGILGGRKNVLTGRVTKTAIDTGDLNFCFIGGGLSNLIGGEYAIIGGGAGNSIETGAFTYGSVAGITDYITKYSCVGAGSGNNIIGADYACIAGGNDNIIANKNGSAINYAFIGGGKDLKLTGSSPPGAAAFGIGANTEGAGSGKAGISFISGPSYTNITVSSYASSDRLFVVSSAYGGGGNIFSISNFGRVFCAGSITPGVGGGNADYAEYFESSDGREIPVGTSVTLTNEKIRPALSGEEPIGVISRSAGLIGNDLQKSRRGETKWNLVGLIGQIRIRAGSPVGERWKLMKKINQQVELWLVV